MYVGRKWTRKCEISSWTEIALVCVLCVAAPRRCLYKTGEVKAKMDSLYAILATGLTLP